MRVLMLNDRLSAMGGADRHLLAILERLRGKAETLLAVGFADGSLQNDEADKVGGWVRIKGLDSSGLSRKGLKACLAGFKELVCEFRPDFIHLHNIMNPQVIAAARGLGPSIMTVQDHRIFCPGAGKVDYKGRICQRVLSPDCRQCFEDKSYGRKMLLLTLDRLAAVSGLERILVLSSYMEEQLRKAFSGHSLLRPEIKVLPPFAHGLVRGIKLNANKYHLMASRLTGSKGVRVALEALEFLPEPAKLVIVGGGPLADEVRSRAMESNGKLVYHTWADRRKMSELLAGAISVWLPSLWAEPFGIVGLEAMSMARPVVASDVGGVADWLRHEENGFLVPAGDARALARAAGRLAADKDLADRLGAAGKRSARVRFDPGKLMTQLEATYLDCLRPG